ncbi:elongation factor 1-delta-like [Corticium candelabrum]|uniref:elongation factor 1-delta-like n=1 Tax=Corticium candelabrum TaxID=121492 RepID=UPI002E25EF7B|nr:elongation factor 1-delta-like [Corticium candelabrum]
MSASGLLYERDSVWCDRWRFEAAEAQHQKRLAEAHKGLVVEGHAIDVVDVTNATGDAILAAATVDIERRLKALEKENKELREVANSLQAAVTRLEAQMQSFTQKERAKDISVDVKSEAAPTRKDDDNDDDDFDLFESDEEEDEAAERLKEERRKAYEAKKQKKASVIAKSSVVLDVKPWSDETDMKVVEASVRSITRDGLVWGASKLVEVGYGIKKLQIGCVVEDEKIGIEDLSEEITTEFEDNVQSVDVAAFNKI